MSSITRHPKYVDPIEYRAQWGSSTRVPRQRTAGEQLEDAQARPDSPGQVFAVSLVLGLLVAAMLIELLQLR